MKKDTNTLNEWFERWSNNQIGFHQSDINPYLKKYFHKLGSSNSHIFVPLCGKSLDMIWLCRRVHKVTGVEFVPKAINDFISQNNLEASISNMDGYIKYTINNINIFATDIFDFNIENKADIFDRASLVALDKNMRKKYAEKILKILDNKMLLVSLEFRDNNKQGAPWSVGEEEIYNLYSKECGIELLESVDLANSNDKLAKFDAYEKVFLISRK